MVTPPATSRLVRWGPPLLAACVFALYLPTLAPGVTFTDGPELVTAVVSLGVAHPTGYPVFILVGHAFCKLLALPLLDCVKIEIFNALCGAGAAFFAAITTRDLALLGQKAAGRGDARDATAGGLAAGLLLAVAPLVWEEVRIPEVYALHLFLSTWAGYAWIRFEATGRTGYVLGAALPMGIGLAHHVTMVYMLPAAFLYLMARRPSFFVTWLVYPVVRLVRVFKPDFAGARRFQGWWGFPVACLCGFLPLLSYGFLIWANKHTTGVPWGDVHDWDSLYGHFTGRQYQGFMTSLDRAGHVARLKQLAPLFDAQFLPAGTVLFFAGLFAAFRRTWRPALFFLAYLLLNVAHGAHYNVGDYGTYYIPAIYACALFMGIGLTGLMGLGRRRPAAQRAPLGLGALGVMLAGAAVSVFAYARLTNRLPAALTAHPLPLAVPLAVLAIAAFAGAVYLALRPGSRPILPASALPALLAGGLFLSLGPVTAARAHDTLKQATVGEGYGAEVALHLPPGAVFLTQGDGFLFTMWYENHVLGRATDTATVDLGNIHTPWFQHYLFARSPVACDPLGPEAALDPAGYARRCDSYRKRIDLGARESWVSLGLAGNRRLYATPASKAAILRGADARCAGRAWHDAHAAKECRCWGYGTSAGAVEGMLEEDCVESGEEGGVVPRDPVEIFAQRIIEDMLDERPVFERNVLTQWAGAGGNPRGWDGPTYQRISGEYALLGRGRFNQVVRAEDVGEIDACGSDTFHPVAFRPRGRPRLQPAGQERRRPYQPNRRPMLVSSSYLIEEPAGRDDDATRVIAAGDPVFLKLGWFERFSWDAARADRRGKPIRHGVRVCLFDPEGRRVASRAVISGAPEPVALLERGAAQKAGTYHVVACDVGDVGEAKLPLAEDRRCAWTLLEYELVVR